MAVEPLTVPEQASHPLSESRAARIVGVLRSGWAATIFFLLAAAAFTWPLVTQMHNSLPDWGDGADSAKNLAVLAHNLRTDPLNLYSSPALYPLDNDLTYGEIMTGLGLLAAPIIWLTGNVPLAYNLLNFSSFVLSGLAMWLLVRHLTGSSAAGIVAGMIFAFSPWHYSQYWHLGLGTQHWMVFALFFLILFIETSGKSDRPITGRSILYLGLFALFFTLQALSAGYYAYYEVILIGLYLLYYLLFGTGAVQSLWSKLRRREPQAGERVGWTRVAQQMGLVAAAGAVSVLVMLPFVIPYAQTKSQTKFFRPVEEVNYWSAGPASLVQHTTRSWLYVPLQRGLLKIETGVEGEMYPGLITVLLAAVGVLAPFGTRVVRGRSAGPWLFAAVSFTGLLLSFGPSLNIHLYRRELTAIHLPYKWLYEHVPGWDSMRVPHRFALLFMLGLAVCAGYGLAKLLRGSSERGNGTAAYWKPAAITAAAALLVGAEFFAPGLPSTYTGSGANAPPLYRWLAGPEAGRLIAKDALLLEVPVSEYPHPITSNPIYQMYGIEHRRPMLNASINFLPPGYERYFGEMQLFPAPATLDVIEALGVKFLIVHTGELKTDAARAEVARQAAEGGRLEEVARFPDYKRRPEYEDVVYRVKPAPERVAALAAAIPEGSTVMLSEDMIHQRLYTNALAALLGPNRRYFGQYLTIYDRLFGKIEPAEPDKFYDRAILYKDAVAQGNGSAGYGPSEGIPGAENETVQVYKK